MPDDRARIVEEKSWTQPPSRQWSDLHCELLNTLVDGVCQVYGLGLHTGTSQDTSGSSWEHKNLSIACYFNVTAASGTAWLTRPASSSGSLQLMTYQRRREVVIRSRLPATKISRTSCGVQSGMCSVCGVVFETDRFP